MLVDCRQIKHSLNPLCMRNFNLQCFPKSLFIGLMMPSTTSISDTSHSNPNSPFRGQLPPRKPPVYRASKKRRTRPISRKKPSHNVPIATIPSESIAQLPATPEIPPHVPPEPQTPAEDFLERSLAVRARTGSPADRKWEDVSETEKCTILDKVFAEYRTLVYPHHDKAGLLMIGTEKRSRNLHYFESDYFITWCHQEFKREIGGPPHLLYYPDVETVDFEAFAYHILVSFPSIMENIRRYKGALPNSVLASILGLNQGMVQETKAVGKRNCGLQTGYDTVDIEYSRSDQPEVEKRPFLDHRRRRSAQLFAHKAFVPVGSFTSDHHYSITQYHVIPYHDPPETSAIDITSIRPPLPEIFADNDPWYAKARKLIAYCCRSFTQLMAQEFADVFEVVAVTVMLRFRRRARKAEEQLLFDMRKADQERRLVQRREAAERAEVAERETGDTYAFVWAVVRSLASNFVTWWKRLTADRIYVDQALQNDRLPLPWKLHIVEREMDFLGYQQLHRARNELPHCLDDCIYCTRINCRIPGQTMVYAKWKEEFTDLFHLMQEYGKVITETTKFIEQKIVDYEDNLHYYRILYDLMVPDAQKNSFAFLQWKTCLFIMSDPIDDFGKMNMLPLQHLLFFARYYPTYLNQIMHNSLDQKLGWPFGLAASYVTQTLKEHLDQGKLKAYMYALKPNRHFLAHYFVLWCVIFWEFDKMWRLYQGGHEERDPTVRIRYAPLFAPKVPIPSTWIPSGKTGRDEMHIPGTEKPFPTSLLSKWRHSWLLHKALHRHNFAPHITMLTTRLVELQNAQNIDWANDALSAMLPFTEDLVHLLELSPEETKYFPWLAHPEECFNQLHDRFLVETAKVIQAKLDVRSALDQCLKKHSDRFCNERKDAVDRFLLKAVSNSAFASTIPTPGFCTKYFRNEMHQLHVQEADDVLFRETPSVSEVLIRSTAKTIPITELVIDFEDFGSGNILEPSVMQTRAAESKFRKDMVLLNRGELQTYYEGAGYLFIGLGYKDALEYEDYVSINLERHSSKQRPDSVRWLSDLNWSEFYTGKQKWKLTRKKVRRFLDAQWQDSQNVGLMESRTDLVDRFMQMLAYQHQVKSAPGRVKLGNPVTRHPVNQWFKVKFAPMKEIIAATLSHFLTNPFSPFRFHFGPFHHFFTIDDEFSPWLYVEKQERENMYNKQIDKEQQLREYCEQNSAEAKGHGRTVERIRKACETKQNAGSNAIANTDPLAIRWKVKFDVNFDRYTAVQRLQEKQKQV